MAEIACRGHDHHRESRCRHHPLLRGVPHVQHVREGHNHQKGDEHPLEQGMPTPALANPSQGSAHESTDLDGGKHTKLTKIETAEHPPPSMAKEESPDRLFAGFAPKLRPNSRES